jgi:hypothetical protein
MLRAVTGLRVGKEKITQTKSVQLIQAILAAHPSTPGPM